MAINKMEGNKASGTDDITGDIIKITPNETKTRHHHKWQKRNTKCLFRRLSETVQFNTDYRIQTRIKGILDENQPKEQAGFRSAYSTTDHLHALNRVIEKANEYNLNLWVEYIDNEKAFNSVQRKDLFTALRKVGTNDRCVQLLEEQFWILERFLLPVWSSTLATEIFSKDYNTCCVNLCGVYCHIYCGIFVDDLVDLPKDLSQRSLEYWV